jgi:hypothetical protein
MADSRLEKLQKQREQIDAKLRQLKAQERLKARRADSRRKIIAGALALEHAEAHGDDDPAFRDTLFRLLNRYVTRPQDRALFGLPERESQEPANDFQQAAKEETA